MVSSSNHSTGGRIEVVRLDEENTISIALDMGCNIFSWISKGKETFFIPDDFFQKGNHLLGGNPVLFPSVGRTWKQVEGMDPIAGEYVVRGGRNTYCIPCHGIAAQGRWTEHFGESPDTRINDIQQEPVSVSKVYKFTPDPEVRYNNYPFTVSLLLKYTLGKGTLSVHAVMRNRGDRPAPAAFGLHPYFRIEDKLETVIYLPCRYRVMLYPELLVPNGDTQELRGAIRVDPDKTYDMAFGGITGETASIRNGRTGRSIHIQYNNTVSMFVLSSGKDTSFICLEPWTSGLGGYALLSDKDWEIRTELPVIPPYEEKAFTVVYRISEEKKEPTG